MTTSTAALPTARPAPTGLLARHPLASYAVLAYAISWLVWSPWVLARNGLGLLGFELDRGPVALVLLLGTFGPLVAALLVTRATEGSVRPLLRRTVQLRTRPAAYVVALLAAPVAIAAAMIGLGEHTDPEANTARAVVSLLVFAFAALLSGPLGEEPGWRGFALPALQRRMHPLPAAVVLGVVWALWHLPQCVTREWDTPHDTPADLLGFLVFTVAGSIVLAWAVNLGRGSVAVAILGHDAINLTPMAVAALVGRTTAMWPVTIGLAALAVVAIIATRGRLGLRERTRPAPR